MDTKKRRLSRFTASKGLQFYTLQEAKDAAIKQPDANGFTFDKKTKRYTLRVGEKIIKSETEDSWIKIPI